MMTTDLGACEWFVWDLRRSNLIDRGQLDQVIGEFLQKNPGAEPPSLAEYLVSQGILTDFQAERLLQGKTQGFVLGPFTLMDSLGSGSMGTVYKARSKNDNRWYAVKVLPRRSMWNVRIARRKVRSFEQCRHPSVVPFVDVGTSGGMHYLAWPMVEGETLDKIVEKQGKLRPEEVAQYAVQTAEGLELCHRQNLFHGLLKPSNLMVGPDGAVRILDFGIGCLLAETEGESLVDTMSTANSVNSGLDCASPESIMDPANLNPLGDQYSLGCVLYYCLTGRYPFPDGTAVEKMMAHQHKQPTPVKELAPETPDELVAIVEQLMQKSPQARFANCQELIEALRPLAVSANGPARRTMSMPRVALPRPAAPAAIPVAIPAPPPAPGTAAAAAPVARPLRPAALPARPAAAAPAAPAVLMPPPRPARTAAPPPAPVPEPEAAPMTEAELEQVQPAAAPTPHPANQQLGTSGVIMMAILAGVVAWLLSSFIKL
jgi:tRNA A-37 threonylcarbamoyl transferase component Bud32